jgi:hypothetical protein
MKTEASVLDLITLAMSSKTRPLDGVVIFDLLPNSFSPESLEQGAKSAHYRFLISASIMKSKAWHFQPEDTVPIQEQTVDSATLRDQAISQFLSEASDLRRRPSFRQLILHSPNRFELICFADHAVADLMSVLNWTRHQLDVAAKRQAPLSKPQRPDRPKLQTHEKPKGKNRFAQRGPSTPLWRRFKNISSKRNFVSIDVDAEILRSTISNIKDITYNDLLIAILLENYYQWNAKHQTTTEHISLWCPINIRESPFDGFGNGSSRIRVYPRLDPQAPILDRCQEIRTQMRAAKKDGEWFVPPGSLLTKLPRPMMNRLARAYFNRPWVDMATAPFSHVERIGPEEADRLFPEVKRIEVIGALHHYYPLGFWAVSMHGRTTLTCVYDPASLEQTDIRELMDSILNSLMQAQIELQT